MLILSQILAATAEKQDGGVSDHSHADIQIWEDHAVGGMSARSVQAVGGP